jgi:hypothetical protein
MSPQSPRPNSAANEVTKPDWRLPPEWARDGLLALWNLRKHLWDLKVVGESGAGSFLKLRGLRATTSLLALQARD